MDNPVANITFLKRFSLVHIIYKKHKFVAYAFLPLMTQNDNKLTRYTNVHQSPDTGNRDIVVISHVTCPDDRIIKLIFFNFNFKFVFCSFVHATRGRVIYSDAIVLIFFISQWNIPI